MKQTTSKEKLTHNKSITDSKAIMLFKDIIRPVLVLIANLIRCMGEALQILGKSSTETIGEQTNNQSVKQGVTEDEIWFRVSLIGK